MTIMSDDTVTGTPAAPATSTRARWRPGQLELLVVALVVLLAGQSWIASALDDPAVRTWTTVFVAISVQALPFLVLGTLLSAAIAAFVPATVFTKVLPRRAALAVPVAGAAGAVLPGCECASVPVARGLIQRGVTPAAALAFLLSSPAINPVVITATAVAMGWLWVRCGRDEWLKVPRRHTDAPDGAGRWETFRLAMQHDLLHAGGFLVVGGITAATLNVTVPREVMDSVSGNFWFSVLALALLAVVLAVCSEADAFVAAGLSGFPPTARLAFMVVGPMVDVKLIALQIGTFGRAFAVRFASATFVVAVLASLLVGWWLL